MKKIRKKSILITMLILLFLTSILICNYSKLKTYISMEQSSTLEDKKNNAPSNGTKITITDIGYSNDEAYDVGTHKLSVSSQYDSYCADIHSQIPSEGTWTLASQSALSANIMQTNLYTYNQLLWILDHMPLSNTYSNSNDIYMRSEILMGVLMEYGGKTRAEASEIIKSISVNDLYAVEQNLIWAVINSAVSETSWNKISNNANLKSIYDAYNSGITYNPEYNSNSNVSITTDNAIINENNNVIGPFSINGNGKIYYLTATANGNSVQLFKDANCTTALNNCTNYSGNFYVKTNSNSSSIKVDFSATYPESTELTYYTTYSTATNIPQPIILLKREMKETTATKTFKRTVSKEVNLKLKKIVGIVNDDLVSVDFKWNLSDITAANGTGRVSNNGQAVTLKDKIKLESNKQYTLTITEENVISKKQGITVNGSGAKITMQISLLNTGKIVVTDIKTTVDNVDAGYSLDDNTITIQISNPWTVNAGYNIAVKKLDKNNNPAPGIKFNVKSTIVLNGIGEKEEAENTYTSDSIGHIYSNSRSITPEEIGQTDTYEIEELKEQDEDIKSRYEINNIKLKIKVVKTYNLTSGSSEEGFPAIQRVDVICNGETTSLDPKNLLESYIITDNYRVSIIGNTIYIIYYNDKVDGDYYFRALKHKTNTDTPLSNASITYTYSNDDNDHTAQSDMIYTSSDTDDNLLTGGKINITSQRNDVYVLKEIKAPPGYKQEIDSYFTLEIIKEYNENAKKCKPKQIKVYEGEGTSGKLLGTINATVGEPSNNYIKYENGEYSLVQDSNDAIARIYFNYAYNVTANAVDESITASIRFMFYNDEIDGTFNLDTVKYVKDTTIPLAGAGFKISIKDKNENELVDTNKIYKTGSDGKLTEKINGIKLSGANEKFSVKIEEVEMPEGYEGINEPITFEVVSVLSEDGNNYVLKTEEQTTIANAKKLTVGENQILVELENEPEGPHKGVKEVNNQNSGYYDEVTGAVYTSKEEIESTLHDWVVTSRIPKSLSNYNKYIITDTIDERLEFSGIQSVKVKILDGETLEEKQELTKDTDYQLTYDEQTRTLKISFIEGEFVGGKTLPVGDIIEIRFNTTFAKDENGNIIAINESVPNQAILTYGDNSGNEISKETETPEVHTGGVGIYKYDEKTGKALQGAKFKIATSKENAENGIFVKDANGKDIEKITNEKGIAVFEGLEFGEDALEDAKYKTGEDIYGKPVYKYNWEEVETTYYIVETESPEGYGQILAPIEAVVKKDNYDINDITTLIQVGNESNIYDLSLRKFITAVKDGATGEEENITTRIPDVDIANLVDGTSTTATYTHPKDPVLVHTTDIVTYTIRIYNEGPQDAYASLIKDDIPEGLEFVQYTEGDGSINDKYRWKLVDENDNEVTDITKAKYIITDYLSQENEQTEDANLLKAFDRNTMNELDYRDVQVQFKVTEPTTSDRILINYAQIAEEKNKQGETVTDRDSTPNEWIEGEDDQDIEKVRVLYFDLALRKWVTQAIVIENGQTTVTETGHKAEDDPEAVVKVDLKKSKIEDVTVKFKYSIRITNEGEIEGEATEIRDDIPQGLKFVAEDNPDWREENGQIITNKLAGTTLQPGESAEVEIILTWVNSESNMGVMVNTAEINKDHNDYGTPDIDSTPGNNVPGEDDIDDAPVMLSIQTGSQIIMYVSITLGIVAIIGAGVLIIKRKVLTTWY